MRLKREEVAKREGFLKELLAQDPKLTIRSAQTKIKEKFGRQMRPHRILQIRDEVLKGPLVLPVKETKNEQEVKAGEAAVAAPAVPGQQKAV